MASGVGLLCPGWPGGWRRDSHPLRCDSPAPAGSAAIDLVRLATRSGDTDSRSRLDSGDPAALWSNHGLFLPRIVCPKSGCTDELVLAAAAGRIRVGIVDGLWAAFRWIGIDPADGISAARLAAVFPGISQTHQQQPHLFHPRLPECAGGSDSSLPADVGGRGVQRNRRAPEHFARRVGMIAGLR